MLCGVNQVGVRSRWIFQPLEKKKEHFLLLRRRGKFRYRRLSGEEIFPDRQKYFSSLQQFPDILQLWPKWATELSQ